MDQKDAGTQLWPNRLWRVGRTSDTVLLLPTLEWTKGRCISQKKGKMLERDNGSVHFPGYQTSPGLFFLLWVMLPHFLNLFIYLAAPALNCSTGDLPYSLWRDLLVVACRI